MGTVSRGKDGQIEKLFQLRQKAARIISVLDWKTAKSFGLHSSLIKRCKAGEIPKFKIKILERIIGADIFER